MKYSKLTLLIIFTLVFSVSIFAQRKFSGTVVDIVDGKTIVLEMPTGRINVELQYIEVPEPEQQLHQTVREHLQRMVGGKQAEFLPRAVAENKTVGQLFVGGVDVSQQMLRDGAAWHVTPEKSGQNEAESEIYQTNEAQAKAEKRGVWSIENLPPAWEFRAQKETLKLQLEKTEAEKTEKAASQNQIVSTSSRRRWTVEEQQKANASVQMWADVRSSQATVLGVGLLSDYFSKYKIGYTSTSSTFINVSDGNSRLVLDHRTFYFYQGDQAGIERDAFGLGFLTISPAPKFSKSTSLTIIADKQKHVFPPLVRLVGQTTSGVQEIVFYKVSRSLLTRIADAKNIQIKLGTYSGAMNDDSRQAMKELLTVTN